MEAISINNSPLCPPFLPFKFNLFINVQKEELHITQKPFENKK